MHRYAGVALLVTLSSCALAQEPYSPEYAACTSRSGGITSNLSDCGHEELARQNARLDQAYRMAMSVLPADKKQSLQASQTLWVKFREADCGMYYSLTGGTMDILEGMGCELSMTAQRAQSVEWFAQNGAEDVEESAEQDAW